MLIIGIDENGLGPVLGPLVVTASVFEAETYDPEHFWKTAEEGLVADDSKRIFLKSKMKTAEEATLTWLKAFRIASGTYATLVDEVVISSPFQRPCPMVPAYCAPSGTPLPVFSKPERHLLDGRERLIEQGITPLTFRAHMLCPGMFNDATSNGDLNKFALDCRLMLSLIKTIGTTYEGEVLALCGKVGSTKKYGSWLKASGIGLWTAEEESAAVSTYRIVPYGRVSFIRDGDASHLPIAVASMVGKYLRELAMRDLNMLFASQNIRPASGYRDKVTAHLIEQTEEAREQIGIKPGCFLRNS